MGVFNTEIETQIVMYIPSCVNKWGHDHRDFLFIVGCHAETLLVGPREELTYLSDEKEKNGT